MNLDFEQPFNVILAEDHTLVRAGIRSLLEDIPGVVVTGEAGDGESVLRLIEKQQPHLVIMDIAMPGLSGLQAAEMISQRFPSVKVLILSMYNNKEFVLKALKTGASGYLLKEASTLELRLAVESIARGEIYLSPAVSRQVITNYLDQSAAGAEPSRDISPRQRQVLRLIAKGMTTKEIARELKISLSSAETHRMRLMERLDIHDVAGLVRFAYVHGMISDD
jgi:DNA-binding NarL/FixJ family response regulator